MTDIVEFIKARLDEDERVARAATVGPWRVDDERYPEVVYGGEEQFTSVVAGGRYGETSSPFDRNEDALHIARHDPARVLREVEAKRRLLEWAQAQLDDFEDFPDEHQYRLDAIGVMRLHLPLLALPYSDHPDWREEWALPTS